MHYMLEAIIAADWNRLIVPRIEKADISLADQFLSETIAAYNGPERYYHNLTHIVDCLEKLEPYKDREDYLQLWLALFWHNEINNTKPVYGNMSNERESAKQAYIRMERLRLEGAYKVAQLIVATEQHDSTKEPEMLINDIDMSVLASPSDEYKIYSAGIREEYSWVDEEQYRIGRIGALNRFARPIFRHLDFVHLNPLAEENIEAEIQELSGIPN